jgi:hypothetical protein
VVAVSLGKLLSSTSFGVVQNTEMSGAESGIAVATSG